MTNHQIQIRINGVWLPVGARTRAAAAEAVLREWIDNASRDNGPDAAQYVRSHTRILRYIEHVTTIIVG